MKKVLALGIVPLLFVVGCGSSGAGTDGGSDGADDGSSGCPGCNSPRVCVSDLGCVDCNPAQPLVCSGNDVYQCQQGGVLGSRMEQCFTEACVNGACTSNCDVAARMIYVVDTAFHLMSFNPQNGANEFKLIGTLNCPAGTSWPGFGNSAGTPFSMSVDRSGQAWVLYSSGEIFLVSTDPQHFTCQKSGFQKGTAGYQLFGMGFVSDAVGSSMEKLFIAGGSADALLDGNIAYVNPTTFQVTTIGSIPDAEQSPELTGTGNAALYGYFPGETETFVAELSKSDGTIIAGRKWALPPLQGSARAWAFAHWGGKFYIFITVMAGIAMRSDVLRLDPGTGQTTTLLTNLPYQIVGAGVSTCAPIYEP
jgi:hypothetical protein